MNKVLNYKILFIAREYFLVCHAVALGIVHVAAIHKSLAAQQALHVKVVVVGVDLKAVYATLQRPLLGIAEEARCHTLALCLVSHGKAVHHHIVGIGEPQVGNLLVCGFAVGNHGAVGNHRASTLNHVGIAICDVGFNALARGVGFGPLVFAFAKHLCFALLQNQPTAVGIGRCGLSEYFVGVWHRCFVVY